MGAATVPVGSSIAGTNMDQDSFHQFRHFPLETQRQIWLAAATTAVGGGRAYQLRLTTIHTYHNDPIPPYRCNLSVPQSTIDSTKETRALLECCVESRQAVLSLVPDELIIADTTVFKEGIDDENGLMTLMRGVLHFNTHNDIIWFNDIDSVYELDYGPQGNGLWWANRATIDWTKNVWRGVENLGLSPQAMKYRNVAELLRPFYEPKQKSLAITSKLRRVFIVDSTSVKSHSNDQGHSEHSRGWPRWLVEPEPKNGDDEGEDDERLADIRRQFRHMLNLQDQYLLTEPVSHRKEVRQRFRQLQFGVLRLSDAVGATGAWVQNLASPESLVVDDNNDNGDNDDADAFVHDYMPAVPDEKHLIRY